MTNAIRYAFGDSSLGSFVAALSERGLAFVAFDADLGDLEAALSRTPTSSRIRRRSAETIGKLVT